MRLSNSLILAGALFAAAPAVAQDNAAAPANTVVENTVDANSTAVTQTTTMTTNTTATPVDTTAVPPETAAPADTTTTTTDHDRGFPWGVLGLVGLIGLLGARKARS